MCGRACACVHACMRVCARVMNSPVETKDGAETNMKEYSCFEIDSDKTTVLW